MAPRTLREGSVALIVLTVLLGGLVGCSLGRPPVTAPVVQPESVVAEVTETLDARASALRNGDLANYLAGLDPRSPLFVEEQKAYFANIQQLPIALLDHQIPATSVPSTEGGVVTVDLLVRLQLEGYDALPVATPARFTFVRDERGSLVVASTRDAEWERAHDVDPAPWALFPIIAEERDGVLGIFDEGSVSSAGAVMDAVARGVEEVRREIRFEWDGHVVVYALSTVEVLAALDNLPGGDPDALDGVAFQVRAGPHSVRVASTRFMLHPRAISRDGPVRDRLVRHELTHVAMGPRDDRVPVWLSEGLAEYVSVQPIAPYDRMISRDALLASTDGLTHLPAGDTFNGPRSSQNYGIAWYACEFIASAHGVDALWRLFDEMRREDGTREAEQDEVLVDVLGLSGPELAAATGRKIIATFG